MVPKLPLSGRFVRKCGHFWSDFGIQVVKCIGLNIGRSYSKIYTKGTVALLCPERIAAKQRPARKGDEITMKKGPIALAAVGVIAAAAFIAGLVKKTCGTKEDQDLGSASEFTKKYADKEE